MDRLTFWKFGIAVLVTVGFNFAQGRQNGDSLAVGESVLVSIFVENDLDTFRVAACGTISCGGVRVQGVDSKGMGYITFHSKAQPNPFQEKWFTRTSEPFGTTYGPGREHTFVIHRPGEKEMLIWLQEKNERKAKVSIPKGEVKLFVQFKNGIYRFLDEKEERAAARIARQRECATGSKRNLDNSNEKGADIVEVSVGCRYHGNEKEQSMCVVYLAVEGEKGEQEIYRSEIARNDYDPFLQQKVRLPFKFHEKQILIFSVYNNYSDCDTPPSEDLIGTLQTSFAAVNTKGKVELTMKETSAVEYSVLFTTNCDEKLTLDLSGKNIPGRGQPFLRILKSPPHSSGSKNHDFTKVAETNKVQRDISFFKWEEITLSIKALCDGDYNLPIKVYVLEEYEGATNLLGHFMTTAKELKSPRNKFSIISSSNEEVFDDAHKAAEIYIGEVPQNATFSQYIAVGFQLVGTLQIDFTASNSVVDPPLHLQSDKPNKYELAIHSVGEVVEPFISDNKFKAFGFGAILPTGETSFDFPLNLTANDPDCFGVEGVMGAYKNTLKNLKEHGPTYFAPAVRKIVNMAKPYQDGSKYFVHLLLTDGKLEDPQETDEAILEASDLPISIVIVGIGDGDFSSLTAMAKPFEVEKSKIKQWNERNRETRDILQFVAMNEFTADNNEKLKHELRQAVLFKIPEQYLEFMKIRKILPKPPRNSTITRVCE